MTLEFEYVGERIQARKVFLNTTVPSEVKQGVNELRGILSMSQYTELALRDRIEKDRIRSSQEKK